MAPTLLLLAAGLGSRYGGSKQLEKVGPRGERLLDYALADAAHAGFGQAVLVIRPGMEADLRRELTGSSGPPLPVAFATQQQEDLPGPFTPPPDRTKPWGTGHAVYAARGVLDKPFAVANADDYYGPTAYRVMADWLDRVDPPTPAASLVTYELRQTLSPHGPVNRGLCTVDDGTLIAVREHRKVVAGPEGAPRGVDPDGTTVVLPPTAPTSLNFWGFSPAFLPFLEAELRAFLAARGTDPAAECELPATVDAWLHATGLRCPVLSSPDAWLGLTHPEDLPTVRHHLALR